MGWGKEQEKQQQQNQQKKPLLFLTFFFFFLQHDSESVNHKKQTRNGVPTIPIYSTHSSPAQRYPIPVHLG